MAPRKKVLVIDVGGTHVKLLATGHRARREIESGDKLTAGRMVKAVRALTADWQYDVVSIGVPAPVLHGHVAHEPLHLGGGWVGFDFRRAFRRPVKVVNDAAMQALGSYRGGNMLFLGLGTGLGAALIVDGRVESMEIAHLPYKKGTYEDYVGLRGLRRGKKKWRRHVLDVVQRFKQAFDVDDVVIGGGNVKLFAQLPDGIRRGANANAFTGGYRLWASSE